jgi:hypothetical protein
VPAIRLLDVQPLFGLGNFRALAVDRLQSRGVLLLGERQAFLPRFEAQLPLFDLLISDQQQALPALVVGRQLPGLSLPMRPVVGQLGEPRLVLAARIPPVANLGFQPCNLGIGRKEVTLCRMHPVAGGKMSFARLLETSLEITQGRVPGFEIGRRLFDLARQPLTLRLRFIAPQQPEQLLLACELVAVFTILASDTGLTLEALHLGPELEANVFDPRQVLACVAQAVLGLLASFLVTGDTGCLFEKNTQFVRLGFDDSRNGPLADDGVSAGPEAGTEKEVGDVLAANMQVVDVVLGLAVARQQALDREFRILRPLAGETTERVVEDQFDRRPRNGFALPEPLKITSCIDSPRNSEAFDSPSTQRTESMTLDLPQPLGPTTPTSWPGKASVVGSTKDLKPASFSLVRRMNENATATVASEEIDKRMMWSDGQPSPRQ